MQPPNSTYSHSFSQAPPELGLQTTAHPGTPELRPLLQMEKSTGFTK